MQELSFGENDIVVVGVPVYAGRIPGFLADYFAKFNFVIQFQNTQPYIMHTLKPAFHFGYAGF